MSLKVMQRIFSFVLVAGMLLGFVAPAGAQTGLGAAQNAPLLSADKVEGQVLDELDANGQTDFFVWMSTQADVSGAAQLLTKSEKAHFVYNTLRATADQTQKELRGYLDGLGVTYRAFYIVNAILVRGGNTDLVMQLASRSDVSQITANHKYQLQEPFKDPASFDVDAPGAIESNVTFINADDAWAMGYSGQGTVMAGNDTGLDWDHPAIINKYRGWDGVNADHNYNWWDATGTYPMVPNDGHGHGTHTTGTMVGDDGVGNQIGVAPGAQTIHCKNMTDGGSGDDAGFTECFEWDLAPWDLTGANADPDMAPDAVNNSWGYWGGGANQFRTVILNLQASGVAVEVSAGNEGSSCQTLRSPGDYQEVLTTGSIQHAGGVMPGTITGFSSRGPSSLDGNYFPDIMAPGENIRSSVPGGGFQGGWSGTSMSGPHATALVGLIWSACPAMQGMVDQAFQIIKDTAVPLTGQNGSSCGGDYTEGPNNDWGVGTIDAQAAVQMAVGLCTGVGTLQGTVTDAVTSAPIENAKVVADWSGGGSWSQYTDELGFYSLTVPQGDYVVTGSHPMYMDNSVNATVLTDTVTTADIALEPRGRLFGYVTDFDSGIPLEGATVTADDGTTTTTDANGFYEMYLDEGTFNVTASLENYAPDTQSVVIVSGEDTQQDFVLQAAVGFTPALEITLDMGATGSIDGTLINRQPWDYSFEFMEKYVGFVPVLLGEQFSIPAFEGTIPESSKPSSTGRAPTQGVPNTTETPFGGQINGVLAYGNDAYPTGDFVSFDTDIPGTFSIISTLFPGASDFIAGADFLNGDYSTLYGVVYGTSQFVAIDTTTGAMTTIGPATPSGGESWSGFASAPDGTLYGAGTTCGSSTLYTIDPGTGATTMVGSMGAAAPCIIAIAVNADGNMYGIDIIADNLVSIDPATGAATIIGYTGANANYAQGMDFDDDNGILYWAAYTSGGEMRIVDTTTGNSVLVGAFPGGDEIDGFATATGGAGPDVPWFGEEPVSGTVPADGTLPVTINFTATEAVGVDQPGDYLATLKVKGDPSIELPVVMHVTPPTDWGKIFGTVSSQGYCDANPYPLEEAVVFMTTNLGNVYSATTDAAGYYQWWFDVSESPVDVSVSFPEHVDGEVLNVVIDPANPTEVSFELRWNYPCVTVTPDSMSATLAWGDSSTQPMEISNSGAADLFFEIAERDRGFDPAIQSVAPAALKPQANLGTNSVLDIPEVFGSEIFSGASPDAWTAATPYPNTIVRYAKVQCAGDTNSFYVLGGVSDGSIVGDLRRYDSDSDTWTTLAPMPGFDEGPSGVCFEDKIYATTGGYYSTGWNIYDIATDTWTAGASTPRGMTSAAVAAWDGLIYVIGGDDDFYPGSGVFDTVEIYDIAADAWIGQGAPMPLGVSNAGYFQLGGFVYVVGGWPSTHPTNSNLTQRYDIAADTWELGPTFTGAKADYPLAATSEALYAIGGDSDGGGYWDSSNTIWRYDWTQFPGGAWEEIADPLPFSIQAHNGGYATDGVAGGEVWSVGGLEGASFSWHADALYMEAEPPYTGGAADVPWLSEDVISGTVPADGGVQVVNVTMDSAGVNQPGDYYATLAIKSNDPVNKTFNVPVTMTVLPADNMGKVTGMVWDNCLDVSLEDVSVFIVGGDPITVTYTDENGEYTAWLVEGDYTLEFVLDGYITFSVDVTIVAGETLVVDVPLVPDRPCMETSPSVIEEWVLYDTPVYQFAGGFDITNNGAQPLDFTLYEVPPMAAGGIDSLSGSFVVFDPSLGGDEFFIPGMSQTFYFHSESITNDWEYVYSIWLRFPAGWNVTNVAEVGTSYCDGGGSWGTLSWFAFNGTNEIEIDHARYMAPTDHCYADYAVTVVPAPGANAQISWFWDGDGYGGPPHWPCSNDGYAPSGYACDEAVYPPAEIMAGNVDFPWFWAEPMSGTVPGETVFNVDIFFSSISETVPLPIGDYEMTLFADSNDPLNPTSLTPVILHVVEEYLIPQASFEADDPVCEDTGLVFTNTTTPGVPWNTEFLWDFGDGITSTEESPVHVYADAGTYTVNLQACNRVGCTEFSQDVEVLPNPEASFTFDASLLVVTFTNTSLFGDTYLWDFGDGVTSTEMSPVHTYAAPGTYHVTLTVVNGCGVATFEADITVIEAFFYTLPLQYKHQPLP